MTPVFAEMLKRTEAGEAQGIVAWHPDRLARNSVDGGRIIYLLDTGVVRDLKFATFSFGNNPQGKFMLSITFGYSKYYVDSLSENVRRGSRTKAENGWLPAVPPIGYLNDRQTGTIVQDPERFALVQRMWELMLTGSYSPRDIWEIAARRWGLRTRKRKRIGGSPLTLSGVYRLFSNPFYAGVLEWADRTYSGKHPSIVTIDDFERVQRLLGRPGRDRRKQHEFAFTGMLRCGECGFSVTAEHKTNRYGSRYTYYHCSKRRLDYDCRQPSISASGLDEQILRFLREISPPEEFHRWGLARLERLVEAHGEASNAKRASLEERRAALDREIQNLTKLRIRDLLTDEEYLWQLRDLERERLQLTQSLGTLGESGSWFEPAQVLISFSVSAASRFEAGDLRTKRMILTIVSSNPTLRDRELRIDAKRPFRRWPRTASISEMRGLVKDVRTLHAAQDQALLSIVAGIRQLDERSVSRPAA